MSWSKFDGLTSTEQQKVLMQVFRTTGLMYTNNTKKSYDALHCEYEAYASVRAWVNEAMKELNL